MDSDFEALAVFNAEVARGIVHTPEWVERMARVQAEYEDMMAVEAILQAATVQLMRAQLRRDPPPFAEGCDHDMEQLPVVDFMLDERCRICGGFTSRSGTVT